MAQEHDGAAINSFYKFADEKAGAGGTKLAGGPDLKQEAGGRKHDIQDYKMQVMLLEQQNQKGLMRARQIQEGGTNGIHSSRPNSPPEAPAFSRAHRPKMRGPERRRVPTK